MRTLLLSVVFALSLAGCDLFDSQPPVDQVLVVGTRVPATFQTTGTFELIATPLDDQGAAILDGDLDVTVEVRSPSDLAAAPTYTGTNAVSGDPLAIAVVLDGSGSMDDSDPDELRVSGAQRFISRLAGTPGLDWTASVYTYSSQTRRPIGYTAAVDSLNAAIASVGSSGTTATYSTLLRVLDDGATERPPSQYDLNVVLLSDGEPNAGVPRQDVCDAASSLGVPIFSIGLGPASDLSPLASADAVEEMQAVAACTNGVYAGIADGDPAAIQRIYESVATATSLGSVTYRVQVSGPAFATLAPGDRLSFDLVVTSGDRTARAPFEIAVPRSSTARRAAEPASRRAAREAEGR